MSKISRPYSDGDYEHINYLYKTVTGLSRGKQEYDWEWRDTWDGPGSVWLVFDDERNPEDQLIGQYSLIPTPMNFWGKPYLAGKTENCMSHPDFRGKGMYVFHEKKYFEDAKKRFQVFFTTTGDVARGAPGKVRQKLGYKAFDYWVTYSLWLNHNELLDEVHTKLPKFINNKTIIGKISAKILTWILLKFTSRTAPAKSGKFEDCSEAQVPLHEIEKLWKENAAIYGISVDRTEKYLKWRINDNPYVSHRYLCYYDQDKLLGYILYTIQDEKVYVVDVLADKQDSSIFRALFDKLKIMSEKNGCSQLKCYTSSKNSFLIDRLRESNFLNYSDLFSVLRVKKSVRPFQLFVYVSNEVSVEKDVWDTNSWYITDLIKEGRSYTDSHIG